MSSAVPSPTAARRHTAGKAAGQTPGRSAGKHEVARGRRSQARLTARAAVLAVAPLRALIDQRNDLARLEQQAATLAERNARLETRIDRFTDPTYLEQLARECLGMVRPGETAFVMVPARGAPPSRDC